MTLETVIISALFAVALLLLLLSVLTMLCTRKRLTEYSRRLTATLDAMIRGDQDIAFEEEKETLIGRIQVKMRSVYEIMLSQKDAAQKEKLRLEETISDISHQVKTPVASLRMYHELLAREDLPETKRTEFLASSDRQLDKLEFLMESMIRMSRLEAGMVAPAPAQTSVYSLIQQAVCDIAPKAQARHLEIQADCPRDLLAWFDPKWTKEALLNLLDNAVKYNREGGQIFIRADRTDYYIRIRIQDTGNGIREEDLPLIFRRFYRAAENASEEGVGIGLFLARQIIQQQKGFLEASSVKGAGSVFAVHLPAEET